MREVGIISYWYGLWDAIVEKFMRSESREPFPWNCGVLRLAGVSMGWFSFDTYKGYSEWH